ncbi:tetraspanin-1-like [Arapaima gigas]
MARIQKMYSCLKFLLMVFCGIIFLSGFAFLGFGAWMKYDSIYNVKVMGLFYQYLDDLAYICMGMGVLLCLVGLTGFYTAQKENWCLITLLFFSLTVLFCTKVVGIVFSLAYRDLCVEMVREVSSKSLITTYMGPAASDPVSSYKCCGFENSIQDFETSAFATNTGLKYPKICCIDKTSSACDGNNTTAGLIYPESCFSKLMDGIKEKFVAIGSTVVAICVMEFMAMIVSMVLFVKRSDEEHYRNHYTLAV